MSESYFENSNPTGINTDKIKELKINLLNYSEELKKIITRWEQCELTIQTNLQGDSYSEIKDKFNKIKTQLANFDKNINYYCNSVGKVLTSFQNTDSELNSTVTRNAKNIEIKEV